MAKADEQQLQEALARIEELEQELEKIRGGQAASPSDLPDSPVKKRKPSKARTFETRRDLGEIANEKTVTAVPKGFKVVTGPDDVIPSFDIETKGSMVELPNEKPGTPESWEFDLRFPSAGNLQGFPKQLFAGILWQWKHSRTDIINPVLLGNHLSLDYRNESGADGLHFRLVQPIREGGRVNDFDYVNYPIPGRPPLQYDHTYHVEIDVLHSSDADGYFTARIDGFSVVDYVGPTMPAYPEGLDPTLQFGHTSLREKTNTVEFTNVVRTK